MKETNNQEEIKKTVEVPKEENTVNKELEELRKFKANIETKQKAEQEKPKEVKVSDTFFSKNEKVAKTQGNNVKSEVKEMLDIGVALHQH